MAKLLVAEDSDLVRNMLVEYLVFLGHEVVAAVDGITALEMFHLDVPDVLITDGNMPGIDGYELCRRARSISTVPIILVTVSAFPEDHLPELEDLGVIVLPKPFDLNALEATIVESLASNSITAQHR